jgi:hypothetical protein
MKRAERKIRPAASVRERISGEGGAVLSFVLMILVILAVLGTAAIMTSTTEVEIAGNEKQAQMAFYGADGGADIAPRVIRDTLDLYASPSYGSGVTVATGFLDETLAFGTGYDDGSTDSPLSNADILIPTFTATLWVGIDVDRNPGALVLPGGGAEFAAGYEGIGGAAAAGGIAILYMIDSISQGPRSSTANVETRYLYVTGVGGG